MAKRFWGINQGQHETDVTEGAADPTTALEVVLDLSQGLSKEDVMVLLSYIQNVILKDQWPPA